MVAVPSEPGGEGSTSANAMLVQLQLGLTLLGSLFSKRSFLRPPKRGKTCQCNMKPRLHDQMPLR